MLQFKLRFYRKGSFNISPNRSFYLIFSKKASNDDDTFRIHTELETKTDYEIFCSQRLQENLC